MVKSTEDLLILFFSHEGCCGQGDPSWSRIWHLSALVLVIALVSDGQALLE